MMKWLPWLRGGREKASAQGQMSPTKNPFLWVEGRRVHADLPYMLPSDPHEINRLDFQHYLIRQVMQCLFVAPIRQPEGILDVGSGTGRWAQEVATLFPRAKVFGLDILLESDLPTMTQPANYRFVRGNVLEELPFPAVTFDYVHQRFLHAAIPYDRWSHVVGELVRVTRPGGWVELTESDLVIHNPGPAMRQLAQWGADTGRKRGIDPRICQQIGLLLQQAGLVNLQTYRVDVPLGNWGGRVGSMAASDILAFNRGFRSVVIKELGISGQLFDRLTAAMQQEWEQNHCYFSFYIACGQRPGLSGGLR